jgi:hypothetical protein
MAEPIFNPPQTKKVTLTRPIWVKGKGLPKDGVPLFSEGEEVIAYTDNGAQWYLKGHYKGREIRVATIL